MTAINYTCLVSRLGELEYYRNISKEQFRGEYKPGSPETRNEKNENEKRETKETSFPNFGSLRKRKETKRGREG